MNNKKLHQEALRLAREHRFLESRMIQVLGLIDPKKLGYPSLFKYCVEGLGLAESVSYYFISVARKCLEVRELAVAAEEGVLSVSKASRIVAAIRPENAADLIAFAQSHSSREIDFEVVRGKKKEVKTKIKVVAEDLVRLELGLSKAVYEQLLRAQDLVSSKMGKAAGFNDVLGKVLSEHLERHDPVERARRAHKRQAQRSAKLRPNRVVQPQQAEPFRSDRVDQPDGAGQLGRARKPLPAATRHAVVARDGEQCTFQEPSGRRCTERRWLDIHHIIPRSAGGSDESDNLTTLCGFHHDLTHQLSFPFDEQTSWFR